MLRIRQKSKLTIIFFINLFIFIFLFLDVYQTNLDGFLQNGCKIIQF